jgi:glycine/D-amino acid oxidase-like deaminating enzyme
MTGRRLRADRRGVLRAGLALPAGGLATALAGCERRPFWVPPPVTVFAPGMAIGHRLRERWRAGPPSYSDWRSAATHTIDVAIVGAGVAGLACAWQLARAGHRDHWVLSGPEFLGNAAGTRVGGLPCPSGSHYLPLPSRESRFMRELLADAGVLQDGLDTAEPTYDERVLVHGPAERVLSDGRWEGGTVATRAQDPDGRAQTLRFLQHMQALSQERGEDGRRSFVVPIALGSPRSPSALLDRHAAGAWLDEQGYRDPALRWSLDYAARDEFGATLDEISAWALVHYFASRMGRARNAEPGAVLTWPDGLAPLARHLAAPTVAAGRLKAISIERIERHGAGVRLFGWEHEGRAEGYRAAGPIPIVIRARTAVVATPLAVAARMEPELGASIQQQDARAALGRHAPWTVANVLFRGPPAELPVADDDIGASDLAWDSIVHGSTALGFVHAQHQQIRIDTTGPMVLSAYRVYTPSDTDAVQALERLLRADGEPDAGAWLDLVGGDLVSAYGSTVWRKVVSVQVTVRGHGIAAPRPGFLTSPLLQALRAASGPVRFAHSELSGYSVFEEAAWWGLQAASSLAG